MAAPRYFYNQPGVVEKSANKSAINVRPAYLDSEYESIGRGAGEDERQKPRPIVAGTVPQRAAAAAAAAAAAERSVRGVIHAGLQQPPPAGTMRPPSSRGPPTPPSMRKPGAEPPVEPPPVPSLCRVGEEVMDPDPAAAPDTAGAAVGSAGGGASASATTPAEPPTKLAKPQRKTRKSGKDRSRHRIPNATW